MVDLGCESQSAAHWSRQQYEGLFVTTSNQPESNRFAWVVDDDCKPEPGDVSGKKPQLLAFLVANRLDVDIVAEWELENIVVAETARRQGLGTLLLREFIAHVSADRGASIFLEVRESNRSARALYQKFGFEKAGLRKNYYADPAENAILYRLNIV